MRRAPVSARSLRRQPLRAAQRGAQKARGKHLPAPVGGWNARDSLDSMPQTDAVQLINWFPRQSDCISRPGYSLQCDTGEAANVRSLMSYEVGATTKLLAGVNNKIIDVTSATPATLESGLTGNDWVEATLSGTMIMVNGADDPRSFNGSAIATPSFSGPTLADLNFVTTHKGRLYFVKKNSQSMYYGGTGSVSGALTEFDFSAVKAIRGNLKLLGTLKGDGGAGGQDDIFVAIFAGGDVLAYTGSNPGDANNWALLGHYKIGRPVSRLAHINGDDDFYVVTTRGYERLSEMVKYGQSAPERLLISDKIQLAVADELRQIGETDDWRMFLHPLGQMLIVTVPRAGSARNYHVRNINTKAWCKFNGFSAYCWGLMGKQPYFGGSTGKVYKFDDGTESDAGATIRADGQMAWNYFGSPTQNKNLSMLSPLFRAGAAPSTMVEVGSDFGTVSAGTFSSGETVDLPYWDEVEWDVAEWAPKSTPYKRWFTRNADGYAFSIRIAVDVSSIRVQWQQTTALYMQGGFIK